jgi:hypothetical protein
MEPGLDVLLTINELGRPNYCRHTRRNTSHATAEWMILLRPSEAGRVRGSSSIRKFYDRALSVSLVVNSWDNAAHVFPLFVRTKSGLKLRFRHRPHKSEIEPTDRFGLVPQWVNLGLLHRLSRNRRDMDSVAE